MKQHMIWTWFVSLTSLLGFTILFGRYTSNWHRLQMFRWRGLQLAVSSSQMEPILITKTLLIRPRLTRLLILRLKTFYKNSLRTSLHLCIVYTTISLTVYSAWGKDRKHLNVILSKLLLSIKESGTISNTVSFPGPTWVYTSHDTSWHLDQFLHSSAICGDSSRSLHLHTAFSWCSLKRFKC